MWVMVAVSAVVLLAVALSIVLIAGLAIWSMLMLVTIVALALVALLLVARARGEMRTGLPSKDERTVLLSMRAGNRAFYVSMYLFLFMAMGFAVLEDHGVVVSNAELLFVAVAIMGSIHIILSAYYNRKGTGASG